MRLQNRHDRKAAARPSFFSAPRSGDSPTVQSQVHSIVLFGTLPAWRARQLLPAALFLAAALLVAAGSAYAQSCTYKTPPPGLIDFGAPLDQSLANTRTAWADTEIQCTAGAKTPFWTFAGSSGSNPLRLKHATTQATIPYSVAAGYVSGGQGNQIWRITATILGPAYQNVPPGTYSDGLIVTISP